MTGEEAKAKIVAVLSEIQADGIRLGGHWDSDTFVGGARDDGSDYFFVSVEDLR